MQKVEVTNKSVERMGLPKDYKSAIAQYVWNGFEAGATEVSINYKKSKLGNLTSLSVLDNGQGINFEELDQTFGVLLDSKKVNRKEISSIHGGKGVGRLSFGVFSISATWESFYKVGSKKYKHTIEVSADAKDEFKRITSPELTTQKTGTRVSFSGVNLLAEALESNFFLDYLKYEFCWFLHLNKGKKFKLKINGVDLNYQDIIADIEDFELDVTNDNETSKFKCTYVRWMSKVSEDSYYHFLSTKLNERYREHTSFNKSGGGAYGFIHSIYVESTFFDDFEFTKNNDVRQLAIVSTKNQNSVTYKKLRKSLIEYLTQKRKDFYRSSSDQIVNDFENRDVFPRFENNKYGDERQRDLKKVVKELYVIEPLIFVNLKPQQEKTILGMLNLLLDSDERENLLIILDGIVGDLSKEEREQVANLLKKTTFSNIVKTLKLIESRYECVEVLKSLVFDLKKFTKEREHIQKVIESNYWLFGEEYRLVSADQTFETALNNYLAIFDEGKEPSINLIPKHKESVKRPDIFLCRKGVTPDSSMDGYIEQNVLVELKRPSINIGMKQYRQIEDYMNYILKHEQFNTQLQTWKFFIVGNDLSEEVRAKYDSFKDKGKRFLVNETGRLEIYALTWSDLFKHFEIKHRYLFEKLSYDQAVLREELNLKGIDLTKESSEKITSIVSDKS